VVYGEPLVPRSFDHRYVPFDDDDVLTAVFEALSERTTDGAAADDDDTHWYDVECFRDVSCETALEDDRQQDGEEDDADEEARRCLHADVLEFHGEQRRDRRRDDATRTDRAHERPLRPRVPAAVRGEVDGDGADDCRDDDDRREPRETELRQVVEGQQRRQRDEHEREDDERHVALERLDLLLVGEVSVAEHHPRRRHRRDARFAAERVGGTVGDQRAREYDETGALGCVPPREVDVAEQVPDDGRDDQADQDADAEPGHEVLEHRHRRQVGVDDDLEHDDGEDGGRHVVDHALGLQGRADAVPDRDHLEDGRDDRRSGRNQQAADEEGDVPAGVQQVVDGE